MTADQKLTTLCVKMDTIEEAVKNRPVCPSPQCADHCNRINKLETTATWQWIAITGCYAFTALVLSMIWGHATSPDAFAAALISFHGGF